MAPDPLRWNFEVGDSGVLAPGRLRRLRCLGWAILLFAITIGFFFASVLSPDWLHLRGNWVYLPTIGLPALGFWVYALLVRYGEKRRAVEVFWRKSSATNLVLGFLIGAILVSLMLLLLWACGLYHVHAGHWFGGFDFLVFNGYISGMLEELAFRAILLRIFARMFGPLTALLLSALCFGLAHLSYVSWLDAALIVLNAGLATGLLYMMTGSLWMSVGLHIGFDFTEGSLLGVNNPHGLLVSSPNLARSAILTGGASGVDGSALSAIVGLGLVVVLLAGYQRWQNGPSRGIAFSEGNELSTAP